MKDYIYKRIEQAENNISFELRMAKDHTKANKVKFADIRERVMAPMMIKSMPNRYKDQISAILWFCYKRELMNHMLFPVLYKERLYSKWNKMPKALHEILRTVKDAGNKRPVPVFSWHFTEGMKMEDAI